MIAMLYLVLVGVGVIANGCATMVGAERTLLVGAPICAALVALTVVVP